MSDLRSQFVLTAKDLVKADERVVLLLADISADRFADEEREYPDRVLNVGIREQLLVSMAGGMSLSGMRPIAHTFGAFLVERAWEQIKLDLDHQEVGAILVGGYGSYDWTQGGRTHQAPGDVALLDTLRNWTVHVPGHASELDEQLRAAALTDERVYIRIGGDPNDEAHPGLAWTRLRTGSAGVVIAVGPALRATREAVRDLDVTLLYAPTVRPFDAGALRAAVDGSAAGRIAIVEPYLAGTSAAEIAHAMVDRDIRQLGLGVGDPDVHRYGTPADHDRIHGLDASGIRQSVDAFLR